MTRIADNDTTNKLTDWIYDVHVYPKNSTTYGQVTIEKKGYTGGGTGVALEVFSSSYRNRMAQIGQILLQTIAMAAPTI